MTWFGLSLITSSSTPASAKIYQDSVAVCQGGKKTNMPRLTFIYINTSKAPLKQNYIPTFQLNKVWIKGFVLPMQFISRVQPKVLIDKIMPELLLRTARERGQLVT